MIPAEQIDLEDAGAPSASLAPCLLVADDQPHILDAIELLVRPQGYRVERARSPQMVIDALLSGSYDALLIDLNYTRDTTSGQEGLDLLAQIAKVDAQLPVIVMTAWANVEVAVEAMRRGARDFIQKPWENARLLSILANQINLHHAMRRAERLEAENRLLRTQGLPEMIATAAAMQPVLQTIARIGPSDANVMITGEHGTGKEVVAQTLHALSARASRSLVAVNTGALPRERLRASSLVMLRAPLPTHVPTGLAASSLPMAERFFSMRLPTCRCGNRPSCCACLKPVRWSAWVPPRRGV